MIAIVSKITGVSMDEPKWETVSEVAEHLRVSEQTVIRLLKKGELKGSKVGKQWRIHTDDLADYLRPKAV